MKHITTLTGRRVPARKDPERENYLRCVFWGTIGMEIITFVVFVAASGVLA